MLVPDATTVMFNDSEERQDEDCLNMCSQMPFTQEDTGIVSEAHMLPEVDSV